MSTDNIYCTSAILACVWSTYGVKSRVELLQQKPHGLAKPPGSSHKRVHLSPKNGHLLVMDKD